jgi:hypothetical protein
MTKNATLKVWTKHALHLIVCLFHIVLDISMFSSKSGRISGIRPANDIRPDIRYLAFR